MTRVRRKIRYIPKRKGSSRELEKPQFSNTVYDGNVFCRCRGKKYGSWIDDGGRTAAEDEDDLIENPAHIIEDLARTAGLTNTNIDTVAFDAAYNVLDTESWEFAGIINESPI